MHALKVDMPQKHCVPLQWFCNAHSASRAQLWESLVIAWHRATFDAQYAQSQEWHRPPECTLAHSAACCSSLQRSPFMHVATGSLLAVPASGMLLASALGSCSLTLLSGQS
jgi:hypothetical protein